MRQFTKIYYILLMSLCMGVLAYAGSVIDISSQWEMKLKYKVSGSFKTFGNNSVSGSYDYDGVLNGAIAFDDDRDFMYYYEKGEVNAFELRGSHPKNNKNLFSENKKSLEKVIEFIIRKGRNVYIEFHTEKIDISKLIDGVSLDITLPKSYGIFNRKGNRQYRKGIKKGSNKICFEENRLYTKMNFKKKFKWIWEKATKRLWESHKVDLELYIKIK